MIKYFSMFSGIGGFEYGMEQSDYEFSCVGFSEVDKYATSIYSRHFPKHRNFGDATKINTEELEDFSFLVGGFPCQAFSIAGRRGGFNDARGTLFFEIARVLRDKKPARFLLENVKGLLHNDCGRTFQRILSILDNLGYNVQWEVYNSKNYGVPQNRERVFLKGYFREKCGREVLSFREKSKETDGRLIQVNNFKKTSAGSHVYNINGVSSTLRVGFNEQILVEPLDTTKEGNAFAITTRHRNMPLKKKQDNYVLTKSVNGLPKIRQLTPLECERLQGFPDNWTKYGKDDELISDTQRYKCCGNAVTTNVITAIINEVFGES